MPSEYSKLPEVRKQQLRDAGKRYYNGNRDAEIQRGLDYHKKHATHDKEVNLAWEKANPKRAWAVRVYSSHKTKRGCLMKFSRQELEALALQTKDCAICGIELDWTPFKGKGGNVLMPSLDRKDNLTILELKDIQIACHTCNTIKNQMSMQQLFNFCTTVLRRHQPALLHNGGIW